MVSMSLSVFFLACVSVASSQLALSSGNGNICPSSAQVPIIGTYIASNFGCCRTGGALTTICCQSASTGKCMCNPVIGRTPLCAISSVVSTTPQPGHLCPASYGLGRFLHSSPVTGDCVGSGTVAFRVAGVLVCNAALTDDIISTSRICRTVVDSALTTAIPVSLLLGSTKNMPLDRSILQNEQTQGNFTFWKLPSPTVNVLSQVLKNCPPSNCLYNPLSMQNAIDMNSCYAESYGSTSADGSGSMRLNKIDLQKTSPATRCPGVIQGSGVECFVSPAGGVACLGDFAGPVYCPLSTGETTLYGLTTSITCNSTSNLIAVQPFVEVRTIPLP